MAQTKDMTHGNPFRLIILFALPLMFGNVFQQLYTVVDTAIVGRALGVSGLAAIGASDWLNWMMLSINQGLAQGFAILMAQQFGAHKENALRNTVGASTILAALSAVSLMLLGQIFLLPILKVLDTPAEICAHTASYLRIMFWGVPIVMAYNLLASILRALGDGRTPLVAMIVASIVNIGLDWLFVLVFGWGIPGAAIATLIAQLCSAVFCFLRLRKLPLMKLSRGDFAIPGRMIMRLYGLGLPMALQNIVIAVGGMIVQRAVNGYSVPFIAGFTATNKLYGVLEIAALSFGYAMVTYVGQNHGAGRPDRIRKGVSTALLISLVISGVISAIMLLWGRNILGLFISGDPSATVLATETGYTYLSYMSCCLPFLYVLHITRSTIQGAGNTVLPMCSGGVEFVVRSLGILLLPALLGQEGIFLTEVFAWMGADILLIPGCICQIHKTKA